MYSKKQNNFKYGLSLRWAYIRENKLESTVNLLYKIIPISLSIYPIISFLKENIIMGIILIMFLLLIVIFGELLATTSHIKAEERLKEYQQAEVYYIKKNNELINTNENMQQMLESLPDDFLRVLSRYLGLKNSDRLSLYVRKSDDFKIIGRYSDNPEYKEKSERVYGNCGYIYKCLNNTNGEKYYVRENLPDFSIDSEKYLDVIKEETQMTKKSIRELNMKSRYYFSRLITGNHENIGILVIESINERLYLNNKSLNSTSYSKPKDLNAKLEKLAIPHIITILEMNNK